jgi:hypothetical protein
MGKGRIVGFSIPERLHFRHLHDVAGRHVKGAAAAVLNAGLGAGKETLHTVQRRDVRIHRLHSRIKMRGQAVDLLGVKNRVALHKGDFGFNLRAFVVGAGLGETVGVNDQRTLFPFANLSA